MSPEPRLKRAMAFIDASNTRAAARRAFGEAFGNFNPVALAEEICKAQGWALAGVSLYLGVPDVKVTEDGHYTWVKRCTRWRKQGAHVFSRTLLHDDQGVAREKGIDIRLALDAVREFRQGAYDVALIFSQDQDFSELASELRQIARLDKRWVQVASAFPADAPAPPALSSENVEPPRDKRGIAGTTPIPILEQSFRLMLDTPENRKRLLARPEPAAAPLPAPRAGPRPAKAIAPARRSRLPALAGALALLYLVAALGTFGHLSLSAGARSAKAGDELARLARNAATALLWPGYWLDERHVQSLKSRLALRGNLRHGGALTLAA